MLEKDKKEKHEAYKLFALLGEEQTAHDNNEEECEANIDKTEDKHKQLNAEIADFDKATEEEPERDCKTVNILKKTIADCTGMGKYVLFLVIVAHGTAQ